MGVRASEKGLQIVKQARRKRGWTRIDWCNYAMISESTLKRFLSGMPIGTDKFISICKSVGIDNWQEIAELSAGLDLGNCKTNSFMLSGIYTEDQKAQIEVVLEHLKNFLSNATVTFHPNAISLAVSGTFVQETKSQVKVTLEHLESLLDNYKLTIEIPFDS